MVKNDKNDEIDDGKKSENFQWPGPTTWNPHQVLPYMPRSELLEVPVVDSHHERAWPPGSVPGAPWRRRHCWRRVLPLLKQYKGIY